MDVNITLYWGALPLGLLAVGCYFLFIKIGGYLDFGPVIVGFILVTLAFGITVGHFL